MYILMVSREFSFVCFVCFLHRLKQVHIYLTYLTYLGSTTPVTPVRVWWLSYTPHVSPFVSLFVPLSRGFSPWPSPSDLQQSVCMHPQLGLVLLLLLFLLVCLFFLSVWVPLFSSLVAINTCFSLCLRQTK